MYSKEQKIQYFKKLREEWAKAKKLSENEKEKAVFIASGLKGVSYINFIIIKMQMEELGLEGLPYLDAKTFQGWKQNGFKVKKGEKSKLHGTSWIDISKEDDEDEIIIPKLYHLFHKSQVEELEGK